MDRLLVVGGGLFGSLAAAHARVNGIDAVVFDAALEGAASPCAAGLFSEKWAGKRLAKHYQTAVAVLESLAEIRSVKLRQDDDRVEFFLFVPPTAILETEPTRQTVTKVGDGWLEAGGERHTGIVYVAAGIWCKRLRPEIPVFAKSGAAFQFAGERQCRIREFANARQAIAFVRDAAMTYFGDGSAERNFHPVHETATLKRAADFGLTQPVKRLFGHRPYTPGGPLFRRIGERTWLGTGGRKMGTIVGAAFAARLVEEIFAAEALVR